MAITTNREASKRKAGNVACMINIYVDGACSGNPGIGASGFIAYDNGQRIKDSVKKLKGLTNSNCAEFEALSMALDYVEDMCDNFSNIVIYTDSTLIHGLMNNLSVPHSGNYIPFFEKAYRKYRYLRNCCYDINIVWIPREQNETANSLVQKFIYSGKARRR